MDKFENSHTQYTTSFKEGLNIAAKMLTTKRVDRFPAASIPMQKLTARRIQHDDQTTPIEETLVYRLGHSSLMLRMQGEYILLDPVFSLRASPVQWAGPKRYHEVPVDLVDLPNIKTVVISHDHYDHLDKGTIKALDHKIENYVMPLGVGNHLRRWGISDDKITELAWWEGVQIANTRFTATPSQHFSGRGVNDRNRTLWAGFAIEGLYNKLYFTGDSGYFPGFKEIGEEFGGFDLTMVETGAYNTLWQTIHMLPEQSVQAHLDLKGKLMMPIHNGTFDLSLHAWHEPLERAHIAAKQQQVNLITPLMGTAYNVSQGKPTETWWRCPKTAPNLSTALAPI